MKDKIKIVGITVSISFLFLIILAFFIKALGILLNPFFNKNALIILIVTGILIFVGVLIGAISLTAMKRKSWF